MWQKMLQVGGGSTNPNVIGGKFRVEQGGSKVVDVFTNNIGAIYFISGTGYYATWVFDGTTFTRVSGTASAQQFTYSSGKITFGNSSNSYLDFDIVIGNKDNLPTL